MTINMSCSSAKPPVKLAWTSAIPDQLSETGAKSEEKKALDVKFKELVEATIISKRTGQDMKGFAESTTAHGLKYAFSEESSRIRRFAWFLAFFTALVYLSYQLVVCSIDYYRYPIKTENKLTRKDSLEFPTVTFCSLNYADSDKSDDPQAITDIYRYKSVMDQLAPNVKDVFQFCMWNGEYYPCEEAIEPVYTLKGRCFRFNGNFTKPRMVTTRAGSSGGFFAVMKTSLSGHTVSDQGTYGFKVLLHHVYDQPDIYSQGILVSPGFSYHISFLADTIKYLPYPYKAQGDMYCNDYPPPEGKKFDFGKHSLAACVFSRAYKKAAEVCGCNSKTCTLYEHLSCFERNFSSFYDTATKTDLFGCSIPCTLRSYRPVISQAAFPSPEVAAMTKAWNGNTSNSLTREDSLGLSLYFEDLILREQLHEPIYNSMSLMGMLGGNMGLLLGASILTVAELFEFLIFQVWRLCNRNKDNHELTQLEQDLDDD